MPRRPLRRHGRRTGTSLRRFSRRTGSSPHSRLLAVTLIGLAGVAFLGGVMLLFIVLSIGAVVGLGSVAAGGAFASITGDLPDVAAAVDRPAFKTASIYDRKGRLLHEIIDPHGGRRTIVKLDEMPQHLIDAVTATEDPRYFTNPGFDLRSIARALLQNLQGGEIVSRSQHDHPATRKSHTPTPGRAIRAELPPQATRGGVGLPSLTDLL